jgi:hypothetical protein
VRAARVVKLIVLAILLAGLVYIILSCARAEGVRAAADEPISSPAQHCGWERWAVKTGQDATASNVKPLGYSDVGTLSRLVAPLPKRRFKYPPQINYRLVHETEIVAVKATIVAYRAENDSDIHLVLSAAGKTMIAEIPCPCCMANLAGKKNMASSPWMAKVTAARDAFLAKTGYVPLPWVKGKQPPPFVECSLPATVTGVTFFDWPHNQHGAAPNAVEIHPVLAIDFG